MDDIKYIVSLMYGADDTFKTVAQIDARTAHSAAEKFLYVVDPYGIVFEDRQEQPDIDDNGFVISCVSFGCTTSGQRIYVKWLSC